MFGGIREICNIKLAPLSSTDLGGNHFDPYQPMLYVESAKTSSLEQAATTVYAQGGRGNSRLIAWEGEKTLTFTFEDALMSPESFAMLSGADLIQGYGSLDEADAKKVRVWSTYDLVTETVDGKVVARLTSEDRDDATLLVSAEAPVYAWTLNGVGRQAKPLPAIKDSQISVEGEAPENAVKVDTARGEIDASGRTIVFDLDGQVESGVAVRIDCYTVYTNGAREFYITPENFAGYYYIEAETLLRDEETGYDLPFEFIIPRGKIQSNFTFTMAATGDPSTFTFTVDCMPGYTKFNKTNKVMACAQLIDATTAESHNYKNENINGHEGRTSDDDVKEFYSHSIYSDAEDAGDEGDEGNLTLP